MIAARQTVHLALGTVRPEFAGLLLDICCFLKGLEDIERECALPARSGKVVLQLALSRVARTVIRPGSGTRTDADMNLLAEAQVSAWKALD